MKLMPMRRNQPGLSIVELIVVVVIVAIIAGISIVVYMGVREEARDSERKAELDILASAIDKYHSEKGNYPMSGGWCSQISNTSSGYDVAFASELAPYLSAVPSDPEFQATHQDYFYRNVGDTSYYLYAELEGEDLVDDGFTGCDRIGGTNNEYDYRVPAF